MNNIVYHKQYLVWVHSPVKLTRDYCSKYLFQVENTRANEENYSDLRCSLSARKQPTPNNKVTKPDM